MQVVVIPDRRAPVITHVVWYRIGGADNIAGQSGLAHFLEHLMFKSTARLKTGELSNVVARLGGRDNAVTTHDATYYFQRLPKEHLKTAMTMEADRMRNLKLVDEEVATERQVVIQERRSVVDSKSLAILDELISAALYLNHSYRIPVIGWGPEIPKLSRELALEFYNRFYAPNNAILIVAGDVTEAEVRKLAQDTFGKVRPRAGLTRPPAPGGAASAGRPARRAARPPRRQPVHAALLPGAELQDGAGAARPRRSMCSSPSWAKGRPPVSICSSSRRRTSPPMRAPAIRASRSTAAPSTSTPLPAMG